jgi:hypothetical protein
LSNFRPDKSQIRTAELNFGINAYLVSTELKKLTDDLSFWHENKTFNAIAKSNFCPISDFFKPCPSRAKAGFKKLPSG